VNIEARLIRQRNILGENPGRRAEQGKYMVKKWGLKGETKGR